LMKSLGMVQTSLVSGNSSHRHSRMLLACGNDGPVLPTFEQCQSLLLVLLLLLASITFAACGQSSEQRPPKELRVGIEDQPRTLDPRYATDAYGMRIAHHLIFSSLVEESYDLQPAPGLAEAWDTPDDTTYVFHLRKNVFFQDGEPLTARDVKFTFEHVMDPETRSPFASTLRTEIEAIEIVDPYTVKFKLKQPVAPFLSSIVIPILPEHVLLHQKDQDFSSRLIGSGPFKLVSQSSTEIVLAANERYFGGMPGVQRLVFKVVTDDNTRFLKMKKGELDLVINALPLDKIDEFKRPPLSEMYRLVEDSGLSYNYLAFNLEDSVLRDVRVRQAIASAINVDEIISYRLNGHAVRATGVLSPVNSYHERGVASYSYEPEKATALLEATGMTDPDGDGPQPRLSLELKTSNNAQAIGVARILQAQLAAVGIRLDIRSYEWGTFYGDIRSGNFRMTTMRWVGIIDPDFYYDIFHSSQIPPTGNNRGRYTDPEMDRLLELGRITLDPVARKAVYSEVQKKAAAELPYISLWHANNISIIHRRVNGYRQHPTGGFLSFRDIVLE